MAEVNSPMYCYHCKEELRTFTMKGAGFASVERSIFRTEVDLDKYPETGFLTFSVHPRCCPYMYGRFFIVAHVHQSKNTYRQQCLRPEARFVTREVKIVFTDEQKSKLMDLAEMKGLVKTPCDEEGFERTLMYYAAKCQVDPGRQMAVSNDEVLRKMGVKGKGIKIPVALKGAAVRGDLTRSVKAQIAAQAEVETDEDEEG